MLCKTRPIRVFDPAASHPYLWLTQGQTASCAAHAPRSAPDPVVSWSRDPCAALEGFRVATLRRAQPCEAAEKRPIFDSPTRWRPRGLRDAAMLLRHV